MSTHDSISPSSSRPPGRSTGGRTIALVLVVGALVVLAMWILARRTPPGPITGAGQAPPAGTGAGAGAALPDAGAVAPVSPNRPIEGDIELVAPAGKVASADLVFRWSSHVTEPIRTWEIRILTGSMNPVWNSQDLAASVSEFAAPSELVAMLQPGQHYQWRVLGKPEKGKGSRVRSGLQDFTVTRP